MRQTVAAAALAVLSSFVAAACEDDAPSTNTVDAPTTGTAPGTGSDGSGSVSSTRSTEGNVGDITESTPVAAGDDDVVQDNQPMLSSATD